MGKALLPALVVGAALAAAGAEARTVTVQGRAHLGVEDVATATARARFDARVRAAASVQLAPGHPLLAEHERLARLVAARDDGQVVFEEQWTDPVVTGDHVTVGLIARVDDTAFAFAACRALRAVADTRFTVHVAGDERLADHVRDQGVRACLTPAARGAAIVVSGAVRDARPSARGSVADITLSIDGRPVRRAALPFTARAPSRTAAWIAEGAVSALLDRRDHHTSVDVLVRGVDRYGGLEVVLRDVRAAAGGRPPSEVHYTRGQAACRYDARPERFGERLARASGGRLVVVGEERRTIVVDVR